MGADTDESAPNTLYFISDLHVGGDEQRGQVDFEPELLDFHRSLGSTDEDAELVVNGDAFGL